MFRFSMAALLALVSFAAVGCAALIKSNELWRQTTITLTIGVLLTATLAAIIGRADRRGVATGFALYGWAYILLSFVSPLGLRDDLLTNKSVAWLYQMAHENDSAVQASSPQPAIVYSLDGRLVVQGSGDAVRLWDAASRQQIVAGSVVSYENFGDIGHSLWAIIVACLGAIAARFFSSSERQGLDQVSTGSATSG
ncbi:MAG: hypothetical protein KY475_00465 [Planctomycetes bacterium]|nr:hypothetical protein [Planctomycetota bacterium]